MSRGLGDVYKRQLLDTLWAEVKMGGPGQSAVLIAIILVFLAVYIAIIIWKKQKRKREMM